MPSRRSARRPPAGGGAGCTRRRALCRSYPPVRDADGFFYTGDLGTLARDGYLRIVGRKATDIIKSGGFRRSARRPPAGRGAGCCTRRRAL
jgi:acyl-CoA synthetase (AMP-forming)/AMP-acid ligase II